MERSPRDSMTPEDRIRFDNMTDKEKGALVGRMLDNPLIAARINIAMKEATAEGPESWTPLDEIVSGDE